MYLFSTVNLIKAQDVEIFNVLSYNRPFNENVGLVVNSENFANVSDGFNFGSSSNRIGIGVKGYSFGAAANISLDNKLDPSYNVGCFVSRGF